MTNETDMTGMAILKQRALEAQHLQVIEGNPFDAEDHAMFAAFERQGLSLEEQRAAIIAKARRTPDRNTPIEAMSQTPAAE